MHKLFLIQMSTSGPQRRDMKWSTLGSGGQVKVTGGQN